jgi:hypothetical protein
MCALSKPPIEAGSMPPHTHASRERGTRPTTLTPSPEMRMSVDTHLGGLPLIVILPNSHVNGVATLRSSEISTRCASLVSREAGVWTMPPLALPVALIASGLIPARMRERTGDRSDRADAANGCRRVRSRASRS